MFVHIAIAFVVWALGFVVLLSLCRAAAMGDAALRSARASARKASRKRLNAVRPHATAGPARRWVSRCGSRPL